MTREIFDHPDGLECVVAFDGLERRRVVADVELQVDDRPAQRFIADVLDELEAELEAELER